VPEIKIEVINAGLPSNRVEELICFLEKNIDLLNPDCIIFLGGMNGIAADKVKNPWKNRYLRFYTSKIGLCLSGVR
jgi:uracil-DNA glycosylase